MAYLLGQQACMESLQTDVQDIQWAITEIISRVGPIQAQSWKFPDKNGCDLDVDDLLDLYDYDEDGDDPEAMQVAHIALYELVIDRLILLIQTLSKFCHVGLHAAQPSPSNGQDTEGKVAGSVGLIVKQHWSQMVKLQTLFQQLQSENKSKDGKLRGLEKELDKPTSYLRSESPESSSRVDFDLQKSRLQGLQTPGMLGLIPPNTADMVFMGLGSTSDLNKNYSISKDTNNKSCQTYETSFVPCESCDVIQRKMREGGEMVIKICEDQGLPCALKKFRGEVTHVEMLSFHDVCRWMVEQNRDIARIGKQNELLQASINPLKTEVKNCQKKTKAAEEKAQSCEKSAKEEVEARTILRRQYETKLKDLEILYKEQVKEEEQQRAELQKNRQKLEQEMNNVMKEVERQKEELKTLQDNHERLELDLEEKKKEAKRAHQLAEEVVSLKTQLADVSSTMENHSKTLAREQGKSRSASKHNESLQAKQDQLLSRLDRLGQENENLSGQVTTLEEEKESLEDSLNGMKVQMKELRKRVKENKVVIDNLESEKKALEGSIQDAQAQIQTLEAELQDAKERERMIVEYPDLNGPVNTDLQGTGDIATDMNNQVTANSIRIKLLEKQNQSLTESIKKIEALQRGSSAQKRLPIQPVALWQQDSSLANQQHYVSPNEEKFQGFEESTTEAQEEVQTAHRTKFAWKVNQDGPRNSEKITMLPLHQEFLVSHGNTPRRPYSSGRKTSPEGKPSSAKYGSVMAPVNATPIGAYTQMKKSLGILAGKDKKGRDKGRPVSGHIDSTKNYVSVPGDNGAISSVLTSRSDGLTTYSCPRCDKMYYKSRDLDIHLSYCSR